ncbi:MAG: hypothetical protein AAGK37_15845 [Pseudomonadota bacterium]
MAERIPVTNLRRCLARALDHLCRNEGWVIVTRYGEAAGALVSLAFLQRALDASYAGEEAPEAKSAIRAQLGEPSNQGTPSGSNASDPRLDADELLNRIDRTRHQIGLPPLDG